MYLLNTDNTDEKANSINKKKQLTNRVVRKVTVESFSDDDFGYVVKIIDNRPTECSCPHYQYRLKGKYGAECKHMERAREMI